MSKTKVNVELSENQVDFLKLLVKEHYDGADGNDCTSAPFFIVQNQTCSYADYNEDQDYEVCYIDNEGNEWSTLEEIVEDYHSNQSIPLEERDVPYMPYCKCLNKKIVSVYGHVWDIDGEEAYLRAYGVEWDIKKYAKIPHYKNAALFFTRKEAERYMQYQKHNLKNPRIYIDGPGYSNEGDFEPLRNILMQLGNTLLKESGEIDE